MPLCNSEKTITVNVYPSLCVETLPVAIIHLLRLFREKCVAERRSLIIASHVSRLLPQDATILDVGCGDGAIAQRILEYRPDVTITGIDLMLWPDPRIQVSKFDGKHIPHTNASFDVVLFVDVLHHSADPKFLLFEATRVAKTAIIVKDHFRNGFLAGATLRLLDWAGNTAYGVALPYNYWTRKEWLVTLRSLSLEPDELISSLGLYPMPASLVFDRRLHFVADLPINRC
jgi:SAM-dependent methyltransferase